MLLTAYTYLTTSSLMADLTVANNPKFFCISSHIFGAKNTSECAIFYWLSTSGFKTII